MGKIRVINLREEQRKSLEAGLRSGKSHGFRMRCQLVLLKSEGRSSKEVAGLVKMHPISVNNWLNRFEQEGLAGLTIKAGRGRKLVLDLAQDTEKVKKAVQKERQRLSQAKLLLEQQLNKDFSLKTLKRFLKKLSADTKE